MKALLIAFLQARARAVIQKFHPTIIAITGSIGKTSTKKAIYEVLAPHFDIRTAEKNYNNEIGLPLTILGEDAPGKSPLKWLKIFWHSYRITSFPKILVLEFGADKPGDIRALCEIAPPTIGIVTGISPVHVANFPDLDSLVQEKASLVAAVPKDGLAILNADDAYCEKIRSRTMAPVVTFGVERGDFSARELSIEIRPDEHFDPGELFCATKALALKRGDVISGLHLKNCLGYAPVMASLAALAVADHFGIRLIDAVKDLDEKIRPEKGRLNPVAGIKGTLILDDSYNAAPAAMKNGLELLKQFVPGEEFDRRIAALGQMMELGSLTEKEHKEIGRLVASVADTFIAVGESMRFAVEGAKEAGMQSDKIEWFATSEEAGRYLDAYVQEGDVIYVKGSQSSRMEKVVKDIMAEPLRAEELLVRQDEKWLAT
ncbi:MAG: Mur ligase family protein [Patescibacteria group bacterium]